SNPPVTLVRVSTPDFQPERRGRRAATEGRMYVAAALLDVARNHGFSSWRALKVELDRRHQSHIAEFFDACAAGNLERLRVFLLEEPGLARAAHPQGHHQGWTGLHTA